MEKIGGHEVVAESSHEKDFRFYRQCIEDPGVRQSIEAEGVFDLEDFSKIVEDPRTAKLVLDESDGRVTLPLMTPLENRDNWFDLNFYRKHAGENTTFTYYNHIPTLYRNHRQEYLSAIAPNLIALAEVGGVLVMDHTDHDAETVARDIQSISNSLGIVLEDLIDPAVVDSRHFHYASQLKQNEVHPSGETTASIVEAYKAGKSSGEIPKDTPVTVSSRLDIADTKQIWGFYKPVFDQLSDDDPVYAGFTEEEFFDFMGSPKCTKSVYKIGKTVVNLCLLTDVRVCPWLNQNYYHEQFSKIYGQGLVLCSPGVITNPEVMQGATSLRTMGMLAKAIKLAGIEPVITFACDNISNKQVPRLTQLSTQREGLTCDFSKPVGHQIFRALKVTC